MIKTNLEQKPNGAFLHIFLITFFKDFKMKSFTEMMFFYICFIYTNDFVLWYGLISGFEENFKIYIYDKDRMFPVYDCNLNSETLLLTLSLK